MLPICPVCGLPLQAGAHAWFCENKHSFGLARQGYVNLLTVDRKHSLHPGDTKEMVAARKRFLDEGHYAPIAEKLYALLEEFCPEAASILDAGCGEGYYLTQVETVFPNAARLAGTDHLEDSAQIVFNVYRKN